jgi:hypothetical protein
VPLDEQGRVVLLGYACSPHAGSGQTKSSDHARTQQNQ